MRRLGSNGIRPGSPSKSSLRSEKPKALACARARPTTRSLKESVGTRRRRFQVEALDAQARAETRRFHKRRHATAKSGRYPSGKAAIQRSATGCSDERDLLAGEGLAGRLHIIFYFEGRQAVFRRSRSADYCTRGGIPYNGEGSVRSSCATPGWRWFCAPKKKMPRPGWDEAKRQFPNLHVPANRAGIGT